MASAVDEITDFQLQVAEGWIHETDTLDDRSRFQFVGYFTALNALYWLWGMVERRETLSPEERVAVMTVLQRITEEELPAELRKKLLGGLRNEAVLLQALIEKLGADTAAGKGLGGPASKQKTKADKSATKARAPDASSDGPTPKKRAPRTKKQPAPEQLAMPSPTEGSEP